MSGNVIKPNKMARALLPVVFVIFCALSIFRFKDKLSDFDTTFMLRKFTYKLTMNFRFFVLKDKFYNETYTKDHHWLSYINNISLDDFQNVIPFTSEELQKIQNNLDNVAAELDQMGIKFYVIIPPNKNTVYPEYLLPEIPIFADQSRLSQLIDFQREHGTVKVIDVRERLNELKRNELVYYETDTHWNPRGTYEGYRAMIEAIQKDFPTIKPIELNDCKISKAKTMPGDLSDMSGWLNIHSTYDVITPNIKDQVTSRTEYIDGIRYVFFENIVSDLPKAFIFRDSFFSSEPFLQYNFRELTAISSYKIDMDLIRSEKPDVIILLMTERSLHALLWFPN